MSQKPYQREQGDFELRILKDGRLVMIAPDETLLEIAQALEASGAGDKAPEPKGNEIVERGTVTRRLACRGRPRPRVSRASCPRSEGETPSTRAGKMPATQRGSEQQHLESHDAEAPAPGRE
jgi:hypothetical protein